ncbi:MAG: hypothetical protein Q9220_000047 [cf. Caloplaca sp. 1 TL-2023]
MPKDRTLNPAAAQLKADKARALKKSKAAVSAQRNERLAQRNPSRLERQIAELKDSSAASSAGLNARDKKQLEELERQLGAVRKAREKVGDKAKVFEGGEGKGGGRGGYTGSGERGRGGGVGNVLGKRSRGPDHRGSMRSESSGSETNESVRNIPMPRDTPPPLPSSHRHNGHHGRHYDFTNTSSGGGNANMVPLGKERERVVHDLPLKPGADDVPPPQAVPAAARTTYEAKPMIRDLRKEAVKAFMPSVVARKVHAAKGGGRLLEEEEMERLEREGYIAGSTRGGDGGSREGMDGKVEKEVVLNAAPEVSNSVQIKAMKDEQMARLEEEEAKFSREVRMEEVSDEDL